MNRVQAVARVQVTVEFAIGGSIWPPETSIEQIDKQARHAPLDILRRGLVIEGLTIGAQQTSKTWATVVGEPKITAVIVQEQT